MLRGVAIRTVGLLVGLVLVLGVGPARSAFSGHNGLLAVDPASGHGIVLATPQGRVVRTVCPGRAIGYPPPIGSPSCNGISAATWSSDGRVLSFLQNADSRILSIVYPDGSCLSCAENADPAVTGFAFTPGDRFLFTLFEAGASSPAGGLFGAPLESTTRFYFSPPPGYRLPTVETVSGHPSQPSVASNGEEAFVSRSNGRSRIFAMGAGGTGSIVPVATGVSPSWSPSGRSLAYVERGWIRILSLRSRQSRRLIRGRDPVFSPDGRRIAYLSARNRVWTISLSGGHVRHVGKLRAVHLDWQPLPPTPPPPGCLAAPSGAAVASGPGIQILDDGSGVLACLAATHRTRMLLIHHVHGPWIDHFLFAGSSVAYQLRSGQNSGCVPGIDLVEVNLATGAMPAVDFAQNDCQSDGAPGSYQLKSWVLAPTGAIAFIQSSQIRTPGTQTTTNSLQVHDSAGLHQIDIASSQSAVDPLSGLAVDGSTLRWTHLGQPRSVQLGGTP